MSHGPPRTSLLRVLVVAAVVGAAWATPTASAAEENCLRFRPAGAESDDVPRAEDVYETAREAEAAECFEQADRLLEGAHRLEPAPRYLLARIVLRERMGDYEFAHDLLLAHRDELAEDPSVGDIEAIDARLREAMRRDDDVPTPQSRSTLNVVGPIILGAAGATSLVFAAVGMSARCTHTSNDGDCLVGREPSWGAVAAYGVGGMVAIGAALVWWVAGKPEIRESRVDLTPSGLRFTF